MWNVHAVTPGKVFLISFCDLLKIHMDKTKYVFSWRYRDTDYLQ